MTNNIDMEFKEWLRAEMVARQITPSDLARASRVPQPTIFRILSGETKDPRTGTVKRIERALGSSSPPIDDADTDQYKVVAEFAAVYRQVNADGRDFLVKAISAARSAFVMTEKQQHRLEVVENKSAKGGKQD